MTRATVKKMLTPVATATMQTAMLSAAQSLNDLVALSGLSKQTVTRFVNELHEAKVIHVGGWARDTRGYPTIRQFSMGNKPDVECPRTQRTAAERMRGLRLDRKVGLR